MHNIGVVLYLMIMRLYTYTNTFELPVFLVAWEDRNTAQPNRRGRDGDIFVSVSSGKSIFSPGGASSATAH